MPEFTGQESAADILKVVLEEFSQRLARGELPAGAEIIYQGGVPVLKFEAQVKDDLGEFLCFYRLDKMTAAVLPACEVIYDSVAAQGLVDQDAAGREKTVRGLAYFAMLVMLSRLMVLQLTMFEENFDDTGFFTAGSFLHAFAEAHKRPNISKIARGGIREMLDERIAVSSKRKRELLIQLLNSLPALHIPTKSGRPQGSTKPEDVKAREAAEYEKKVEAALRKLIAANKGEMPTKKAVAKELGIGGLSAGGTDSTLTNFGRKLRGLKIDYDAIVERVKVDK